MIAIPTHFWRTALSRAAPMLALLAVVLLFRVWWPAAGFSVDDVRTILLQSGIVAIAALGASLVIVAGGIDLSVGSVVALASVAAAKVMLPSASAPDAPVQWWQPTLAVAAAVTVGAVCGLYNGVLVTKLRLPPFIATLGTLGFFRGVAKYLSESQPVYSRAGPLNTWVALRPEPWWLLVAPAAWMALGLSVVLAVVIHGSVFGRRAVAIGSNEEAALRCAVPVERTKIWVYVIAGMLVGFAGVVQFARLGGSGDPTIQVGLELKAIAAVVIGGASLAGGHVSIVGTMCGVVLLALLENRCTAVGLPNYAQEIIVGHIIIVAVAVDRARARK